MRNDVAAAELTMTTDNHWRGEKTIEICTNLVIDWTRACEELKEEDSEIEYLTRVLR